MHTLQMTHFQTNNPLQIRIISCVSNEDLGKEISKKKKKKLERHNSIQLYIAASLLEPLLYILDRRLLLIGTPEDGVVP